MLEVSCLETTHTGWLVGFCGWLLVEVWLVERLDLVVERWKCFE
jgi:hypothetical protein